MTDESELVFDDEQEPNPELNRWTNAIIGAAIEVHKSIGPGFSEENYCNALEHEFKLREIPYEREAPVVVVYKGVVVGQGRMDFLIAGCVVVEIKSVETLGAIHVAQALSYLRATKLRLCILLNFNVRKLVDGIRRVAL